MAVSVTEKAESRRLTTGANPSVELVYTVSGATDDAAAMVAVNNTAPTTYDPYGSGIVYLPIECVQLDPVPSTNGTLWYATVRYSQRAASDLPTSSFDTTGGTQHIIASRRTVNWYPQNAPANVSLIGQTEDGVEGCDIAVPVYSFSETHYYYSYSITTAFKRTLFALTSCVNSATFKEFNAGECKFDGASGTSRGDGKWEITYKFSCLPNRTSFDVAGITVASKNGWDYLWVRTKDKVDTYSKAIVKIPLGVYIEQVYDYADLNALGI